MSSGRICISTKSHNFVSERVLVEVQKMNYDVHVHELVICNINIIDESSDNIDANGLEKAENYVDKNSFADLNAMKETINELASNRVQHPISKENIDQEDNINNISPEIRYRKKDIKGVSLIEELSRIIENRIGDFMHQHAAGTKLSKLDRFLISEVVAEDLPDVRVTAIDRLVSIPSYFVIHLMKLSKQSYQLEEHNFGRKLLSHEKFCLLKARIKQWRSETKASDYATKHDNLQLIKFIEEKIQAASVNDDDRDSRNKLLEEVDRLDTFESFDFFQKARVKWDIEELVYPHLGLQFSSMVVLPWNFLSNVASGKDILSSLLFLFLSWRGCITLSLPWVSDVDVSYMASNSVCASGSFPFTYLGLPIGSNMSLTSSWQRPNLGARKSSDLLHMLFEISYAEINKTKDTCVWSMGTDGAFSLKDARCIIDSKILPSLAPSTVWDKNIPRKVSILIWRLILARLPHKLNLSTCGIDI
nr:hypothetical protein [Tanacetum cinerariifolium]